MDETTKSKYLPVKIDKYMKIRLLKACVAGVIHPEHFPELFAITPVSLQLLSDKELQDIIDGQQVDYEEQERD